MPRVYVYSEGSVAEMVRKAPYWRYIILYCNSVIDQLSYSDISNGRYSLNVISARMVPGSGPCR